MYCSTASECFVTAWAARYNNFYDAFYQNRAEACGGVAGEDLLLLLPENNRDSSYGKSLRT